MKNLLILAVLLLTACGTPVTRYQETVIRDMTPEQVKDILNTKPSDTSEMSGSNYTETYTLSCNLYEYAVIDKCYFYVMYNDGLVVKTFIKTPNRSGIENQLQLLNTNISIHNIGHY